MVMEPDWPCSAGRLVSACTNDCFGGSLGEGETASGTEARSVPLAAQKYTVPPTSWDAVFCTIKTVVCVPLLLKRETA